MYLKSIKINKKTIDTLIHILYTHLRILFCPIYEEVYFYNI